MPVSLRRVRTFAPARRAKAGALPVAAALARDVTFRQEVAEALRAAEPDLAAALDADTPPAAADPVDVAVAAYLLRPPGWQRLVELAAEHLGAADERAAAARLEAEAEEARTRESAARAEAEAAVARARAVESDREEEVAALRRELRRHRSEADRARAAERAARQEAQEARADADARVARVEAARDQALGAAQAAQQSLEALRRADREGRSLAGARARLLLDALTESATGLRRELGLPPSDLRPADVAGGLSRPQGTGDAAQGVPPRARAADDPSLVHELVSLPQAHLVVDGYNVTKTAYAAAPLEEQRRRLVAGLAALAARTGAEVTCCFDGAVVEGRVVVPQARGVRVLFSEPGQTADELIRRLVAVEPQGRVVVVASSDREVADGVAARGARPVTSVALARLLERG